MRKWSIAELDHIEFDMSCLDGDLTEADAEWLSERIGIRELNGTFGPGQCDSCGLEAGKLLIYVDDYSNSWDGPSSLSSGHLCSFCR